MNSDPGKVQQQSREMREKIARRAYELYEERGGLNGHDREDWLQAELEIRQQETLPKASVASAVYED